ncbi:MAG TPA: phosphoglucosamine mutase [Armatimonadota bacterium]|nr:phosphoglucosamine mutase [Armatimonadota bacterium]
MDKLFGTDGVRGIANTELSALLALKLGSASAYVLRQKHEGAKMLIGRDPRISGDILESAMASGICSLGVDVYLAGVVPTPGVAFLSQMMHADAGIVISASHNPMRDNGIKFFGSDGCKLPDEVEAEIEDQVEKFDKLPRPEGAGVGRMYRAHELVDSYLDHLRQMLPRRLGGMKIVLDCANGAVYDLAPRLFSELGAQVTATNNQPDGLNINANCGSLHPEALQELVLKKSAQIGMAFDGDGDRAILVDEKGKLVDGDHVMLICARQLAGKGRLPGRAVVATVMSNIGLELALARDDIALLRTQVGDRYVSDEMRRTGAAIGGEKSGHIIFAEHATTGDGMVTALQILDIMLETGKPLSELAAQMEEFPQLLINVPVKKKDGWDAVPEIVSAVKAGEERLSGRGRVFVRASGTERLIRVMAEGPDLAELEEITGDICSAVKRALT